MGRIVGETTGRGNGASIGARKGLRSRGQSPLPKQTSARIFGSLMENVIHWFSRNHVAANFIMLLVLVLGISTWFGIRKEIFPETSVGVIAISVPYPNATPLEVERGVVIPIEEAIQDLEGIDRMGSTAAQNVGVVTLEVDSNFDLRQLLDNVKTRIDAVDNFAENAEQPVYEEILLKMQVLNVAVSADTDEGTLRGLAEQVRDELLNLEDVTQVEIAGTRPFEIGIEVSETRLRELGLTFDAIANAVRLSSLDLPGGSIKTAAGEVLIRTEGRRYSADEFASITVSTQPDGSVLKLGEVATITDGFEEVDLETRFDGRPALLVKVFRTGNEDTLKVAAAVKKFINERAPTILPAGVELEVWKDDSVLLDGRLKLLGKNGLTGLILVFIVLALFLRPSLALLVSIGIPVSFAGAVLLMPYTGISINMISLFAFILVLGIVVDDAIVVGENVFSRMRKGEDPKIAAPKGTHEVGMVVIFGILTTAVAFTPMLGLSGVSGKIWPNIPLIVIPTLIFSLFQSKLVLPAHLALLRKLDPDRPLGPIMRFQNRFSRGLEGFINRFYRPLLRVALEARYLVLLIFVAVFAVVMAVPANGWLKFQFFPAMEADVITAKLELAEGVAIADTAAVINRMEAAARQLEEEYGGADDGRPFVRHILTSIGNQPFQVGFDGIAGTPTDTHLGQVTCELRTDRGGVSVDSVVSRWREIVGPVPGAVVLTFASEAAGGGNAIDLEISGPDEDRLAEAAQVITDALDAYPGVIDISSSNRPGKRQIEIEILPRGEALGLRLGDVARQVRQGFYGEEAQRLQRGRDEVKVMVRYPKDARESLADLENMRIRTRTGEEVPFSAVATASFGRGYSAIRRADRRRAVSITADIDALSAANATEVVASLEEGTKEVKQTTLGNFTAWLKALAGKEPEPTEIGALGILKRDFPEVSYGFQGEQKDQRQSVQEIMRGFLLALLVMYVLMAIPLGSYVQPLIIMSVIPFGVVGAVIGHIIMRTDLSIMSMCGIVALAGVVVNDSLVLVDYVNRWRKKGGTLVEAAWEAGAARFRPILLTSLTTFAGLTPMLFETDLQARFLIPMAISLGFGILFATLITLILVPCIYLVLEDIRARLLGKPVELEA